MVSKTYTRNYCDIGYELEAKDFIKMVQEVYTMRAHLKSNATPTTLEKCMEAYRAWRKTLSVYDKSHVAPRITAVCRRLPYLYYGQPVKSTHILFAYRIVAASSRTDVVPCCPKSVRVTDGDCDGLKKLRSLLSSQSERRYKLPENLKFRWTPHHPLCHGPTSHAIYSGFLIDIETFNLFTRRYPVTKELMDTYGHEEGAAAYLAWRGSLSPKRRHESLMISPVRRPRNAPGEVTHVMLLLRSIPFRNRDQVEREAHTEGLGFRTQTAHDSFRLKAIIARAALVSGVRTTPEDFQFTWEILESPTE
ncbi:hypothetical protein FA15DRAFT_708724 [Coprinopsis marcescibilis]|uniref:Uncharacterized protein n=1 Tax=Coprinopsis marcescibilis TaxID=230819 RepID=A0A5C3KIQ2_COPMA|nr:hypothetical protein FA15DRAFT_708724 [Coprinopsis marcescibilis]